MPIELSLFQIKIMKIPDRVRIKNCVLELRNKNYKYAHNKLSPIFHSWFKFLSNSHSERSSTISTVITTTYDKGALSSMAKKTWYNIQR